MHVYRHINFISSRDHWDYFILCGSLGNFNFILVEVIINHVILCGFIVDINYIFTSVRWAHIVLCGYLAHFSFILIVVVINHPILQGL